MGTIRVTHTMHHDSGLPEDDVVNVFHFVPVNTPITTDYNDCKAAVEDFFDGTHFGSSGVAAILGVTLNGAATTKVYDLADPEPRVPKVVHDYTMTSYSGQSPSMPEEVAICLSFSADPVSGLPAARRRGRLYIGPLGTASFDASGKVTSGNRLILRRAGRALLNDAATNWAILSRVDNTARLVTRGWVDNAADIQRRRGPRATLRELWDGTTP